MSPRALLAFLAPAIFPLGTLALHAVESLSIQSPRTRADRRGGPEDVHPTGNTTAAHPDKNVSMPSGRTMVATEDVRPAGKKKAVHPDKNISLPPGKTMTATEDPLQRCTCDKMTSSVRPRLAAPPRKEGRGPVILVTVSEHVAGMLQASLACNRALVDRVVVITSSEDEATRQACIRNGVECEATSLLHHYGDPFNKGRAIRAVQQGLHKDPRNANATILLVDSDVCLPSDMWRSVPNELQKGVIYSVIDRCMFASPADYSFGWPAVRARWSQFRTLGMFQMYACDADAPLYSDAFKTAAVSDLEFSARFSAAVVLPIAVNHMGVSPNYTQWWGSGTRDETLWAHASPPPDGSCPCCDFEGETKSH